MTNLTAAQAAQQNNRDHGGRYAEKAGGDPGALDLAGRPTADDLLVADIPADKVFAAANRVSGKDNYRNAVLDRGYVYGTDGYILMRARSSVADRADRVSVPALEAKRLTAATKGANSPGVRLSDGADTWLELGGEPVHVSLASGPSPDVMNRIVDDFYPDEAALPGIPESWERTDHLIRQVKGRPAWEHLRYGEGSYDPARVERALRCAKDMGARQVFVQVQSPGKRANGRPRRPQIRVTGAGFEIVVQGRPA